MGKAYSAEQRARVKALLELGRDEEAIEKETGVSDRTIRRWKLELERTGRIGKPPESRTGRHRVLNPEVEAALFEHVKDKPEMSVDDMLWWLYETYKIVVGTRTIRRVFERKGNKVKGKSKGARKSGGRADGEDDDDDDDDDENDEDDDTNNNNPHVDNGVKDGQDSPMHVDTTQYQSPYGPLSAQAQSAEQQLAHALQQQQTPQQTAFSAMQLEGELPDDEETIQLQLQQIALQKREVELKLKMRRLQNGKGTPVSSRKVSTIVTPQSAPSSLYNPTAALGPSPPKRDSRSKKKIEESKRRTAERQERMLRDLERRSRRRDHLTAEWVQSKDIWPLRAQGVLADLMHQYGCYAFSQSHVDTFEAMYQDLYQLVDLSKGDWVPHIHNELLRERMKRKMGQLRIKMQKTGEIVGRTDGYAGFQKAENYTGEQAGAAVGDESELPPEMQVQAGAPPPLGEDQLQYEPVPDHSQMQASNMPYAHAAMLATQQPGQYPMMDHNHPAMLPYGQMNGQQGGIVM